MCQTACWVPAYQLVSQQRHIKNNVCEFLSGIRVGSMGMGVCRRNGTPEASRSAAPGPGTSGVLRMTCSII